VKDLVDESSAEGMIDVLREERAGDVNLWEMQEEEEKAEEPSTPEKVDKSIDVDLDNHELEENKADEMECDQAPQASTEPTNLEDVADEKDAASTSDSNKENVSSETESSERTSKAKEVTKPAKPFTTVNPKAQKKALTPGSRGAMLLNLSRRTKDSEVTKSSPASSSLISSPRSCPPQALGQGPRPWVKYAPSPSHASPSAGILKSKRTADELDTSSDGSPVLSAKRLRLDPDRDGIVPRRVHFNDNPVSESVEIPRTPKQQFTRKRLQLASFTDPEDKEEEMEGVTSLVMYPDLVDNKDNISSVLHKLAPGQWYKNLEQDLKKNNITTIGQLANLDVKTVVQLKVKPPKVQTVKIVLAAYHSKIKKEENTFRKGTPVQEETSQEEEERIKEALFSNPTPSPDKDMLGDQDTASEAKEQKQIDHSEGDTKGDIEACTEGDTEDDKEGVTEADKEADTEVVTEEAAVDKEKDNSDVHQGEELVEEETTGKDETTRRANTIPAEATAESSVNFIPETESLSSVKTNCSEASEELKNCDENEAGPVKPTFIVEEMEVGDRDVEAAETIEKSVEMEQDEEAAKLVEDEKNEEEEQKEPSSDVNEKMGEKKEEAPVHEEEEDKMKEASNPTPSAAPVTDIMAVLNDTELNLSVQSTKDLIELYERFSSHQKEVDQFKDNISKILFGRMK